MEYRFRIGQDELRYLYESAKGRMEAHPDIAEKHTKIIQEYPFYESEGEALKAASNLLNSATLPIQIWAKIERDEEFFFLGNYYIVTDDNMIKISAEYIGMAQLRIGVTDNHVVSLV